MPRSRFLLPAFVFATLALSLTIAPALALEKSDADLARAAIAKGLDYLKSKQADDGSWSPKPGPAVTAMVLTVILDQPGADPQNPVAQKALAYILKHKQDNGGIHGGMLENYNTAICLSALARVNNQPGVADAIKKAQDYLRDLQWAGQNDPQGKPIDAPHAFFGGAGYGKDGRPDMSNTHMMLQGLHDSGLDCNDPAFQRAMVFITRCQGVPENKDYADKIAPDGGFIYATSQGKDKIGTPESKAGESKMEDGTTRLATYGSMTYAGFKSYIFAQLDRKDPRVQAAYNWIRHNYTLERNPGLPEPMKLQGLYYYYMTFARAMRAWGEPTLTTADGKSHDWRSDLIRKLATLQKPDGSFLNEADRWLEGDPNLVTAYALIALTEATK